MKIVLPSAMFLQECSFSLFLDIFLSDNHHFSSFSKIIYFSFPQACLPLQHCHRGYVFWSVFSRKFLFRNASQALIPVYGMLFHHLVYCWNPFTFKNHNLTHLYFPSFWGKGLISSHPPMPGSKHEFGAKTEFFYWATFSEIFGDFLAFHPSFEQNSESTHHSPPQQKALFTPAEFGTNLRMCRVPHSFFFGSFSNMSFLNFSCFSIFRYFCIFPVLRSVVDFLRDLPTFWKAFER